MHRHCNWCGAPTTPPWDKCSGCSTLVRPFLGLMLGELPSGSDLGEISSLLEPARGLSEDQRFAMLSEEIASESELPRGFRSRRGRPVRWGERECEDWSGLAKSLLKFGRAGPGCHMLPGGCVLSIDPSGTHYLDHILLPNKLPLLDIAIWLSNPHRAGKVADWRAFLLALSCVAKEIGTLGDEDWAEWFDDNNWSGIDAPASNISHPRGENTNPYMQFIGLQCKQQPNETTSIGYIARSNSGIMEDVGGRASVAWLEILEMGDEEIRRLWVTSVSPRLVVNGNRLHLIALDGGKPALIHITADPKVWRALVSWSMEPPGSPGSKIMQNLFWRWKGEDEDWMPTNRQLHSAQILSRYIETLGDESSLTPVVCSDLYHGLGVQGQSGIYYLILGTIDPHKFAVFALPNKGHLLAAQPKGIFLCIDVRGQKAEPAGDIATTYLLSLRNDVVSRNSIVTLHSFLSIVSKCRPADGAIATAVWWNDVHEKYDGYLEEMEEYLEEEEYLDGEEADL